MARGIQKKRKAGEGAGAGAGSSSGAKSSKKAKAAPTEKQIIQSETTAQRLARIDFLRSSLKDEKRERKTLAAENKRMSKIMELLLEEVASTTPDEQEYRFTANGRIALQKRQGKNFACVCLAHHLVMCRICATDPRLCEHKRERRLCPHCDGPGICEHNKISYRCQICKPHLFCEHNQRTTQCKICSPPGSKKAKAKAAKAKPKAAPKARSPVVKKKSGRTRTRV